MRKIFFAFVVLVLFSLGFKNSPSEKRMQKPLVNRYAPEECTYHAFQMRPDLPFHDHAKNWARLAEQAGYAVDKIPQVGDIVVFGPGVLGADSKNGHVAFVEAVDGNRVSLAETGWGLTKEQRQQVHRRTITITDNRGISFIHQGPENGKQQAQLPTATPRRQPTQTPQPQPTTVLEFASGLPNMWDAAAIVRWTVEKVESGNIEDLAAAIDERNLGVESSCDAGYSGKFIGCGAIKVGVDDASSVEEYASQLRAAVTTQPVCKGYFIDDEYYPYYPLRLLIFFTNMPLSEAVTGSLSQSDVGVVAFGAWTGSGVDNPTAKDQPFQLIEIAQESVLFANNYPLEPCP